MYLGLVRGNGSWNFLRAFLVREILSLLISGWLHLPTDTLLVVVLADLGVNGPFLLKFSSHIISHS